MDVTNQWTVVNIPHFEHAAATATQQVKGPWNQNEPGYPIVMSLVYHLSQNNLHWTRESEHDELPVITCPIYDLRNSVIITQNIE